MWSGSLSFSGIMLPWVWYVLEFSKERAQLYVCVCMYTHTHICGCWQIRRSAGWIARWRLRMDDKFRICGSGGPTELIVLFHFIWRTWVSENFATCGGSWNQSPKDTKGQLSFPPFFYHSLCFKIYLVLHKYCTAAPAWYGKFSFPLHEIPFSVLFQISSLPHSLSPPSRTLTMWMLVCLMWFQKCLKLSSFRKRFFFLFSVQVVICTTLSSRLLFHYSVSANLLIPSSVFLF